MQTIPFGQRKVLQTLQITFRIEYRTNIENFTTHGGVRGIGSSWYVCVRAVIVCECVQRSFCTCSTKQLPRISLSLSLSISVTLVNLLSTNVIRLHQLCLTFQHFSVFLITVSKLISKSSGEIDFNKHSNNISQRKVSAKFNKTYEATGIVDSEQKKRKRDKKKRERCTVGVQCWEWMRAYNLLKSMNGMVQSEKADSCQKRENLFWQLYWHKRAFPY